MNTNVKNKLVTIIFLIIIFAGIFAFNINADTKRFKNVKYSAQEILEGNDIHDYYIDGNTIVSSTYDPWIWVYLPEEMYVYSAKIDVEEITDKFTSSAVTFYKNRWNSYDLNLFEGTNIIINKEWKSETIDAVRLDLSENSDISITLTSVEFNDKASVIMHSLVNSLIILGLVIAIILFLYAGFKKDKFIELILNNISTIIIGAAIIVGLIMRIKIIDYESPDFIYCLYDWYAELRAGGGFKALNDQTGNYNIPYQILIAILTYIPVKFIYGIKSISFISDFIMAIFSGKIVNFLSKNKYLSAITFTIVWCSPIVTLNSGAWGQCDSLYTMFIIMMLYCLISDKHPALTYILLGFAFAFKLQTAFILPFILFAFIIRKRDSVFYMLLTPFVMIVLSLPAVLMGRPVNDIFEIYVKQTGEYKILSLNYPNFVTFINSHTNNNYNNSYLQYDHFAGWLIAITAIIIVCGLAFFLKNKKFASEKNYIYIAFLSIYTCVIFLPSMHERYGFAAEILAIIIAMTVVKSRLLAIALNAVILIEYGNYLGGYYEAVNIQMLSAINIIIYILYIIILVKEMESNEEMTLEASELSDTSVVIENQNEIADNENQDEATNDDVIIAENEINYDNNNTSI